MNIKKNAVKLKEMLPKSKSSLLIIVGIIGLLLVLLSTFSQNRGKIDDEQSSSAKTQTNHSDDEYVLNLEKRLENIISDMLGGTSVNVMITLESGTRYVYANEVKTDAGTKDDRSSLKTEQSDSNQQTYVVMKDSDGNEQALLVTEIMPVVRGVVIVCESGQTDSVSSAVRTAVQSALDIDAEKICIIGRY